MSSSENTDRVPDPVEESFTNDFLVDPDYEQDVLEALAEIEAEVSSCEVAGRHGLLRIRVDGVTSDGKLSQALYQCVQRTTPAAVEHYGHNRHYALGALTASLPDPKIWGSGEIGTEGGRTIARGTLATPPQRPSEDAGLGVVVGVLDTKITSHPYLDGGYLALPDSIQGAPPRRTLFQESGHATFVTGLILQQAPAATVHVRQVLGEAGSCDSITLHDAIIDMARQPIDILNLSLGCTTADDRAPFVIRRALRRFRAERPEAVVVAAGGNHPSGRRFWPAALPDVLGVTPASQSPGGGWDEAAGYPTGPWVDVAAPGSRVVSTFLYGNYLRPDDGAEICYDGWAVGSGSSFACAVATGYLARMWTRGSRIGDLLATARHAGVPTTRTGGRLVLGSDRLLR